MNDKRVLDDQAIRALLEKRAGRPDVAGRLATARSVAAATSQRRRSRSWLAVVRSPALAGAAGLALLIAIVAANLLAGGGRLPGTGTASGEPTIPARSPLSSTPSPSASPAVAAFGASVLPLTVTQLNAVLGSYSLVGRQLVITGSIQVPVISSHPVCCSSGPPTQPAAILVGSTPLLQVESAAPALLADPFPFLGTFAAKMVDARTLDFEGIVTTSGLGGPIMPSQLPASAAKSGTDQFWLVSGWIAGLEADLPCPAAPDQNPTGPQYGCGRNASLSDTGSQPVSGFELTIPKDGVRVQNDAYDDFAANPEATGTAALPEQAEFLVRAIAVHAAAVNSCPSADYCPFNQVQYYWAVFARIDPWPVVPSAPSPTPAPSFEPVLPLTVEHLTAALGTAPQTLTGRELVITGELVYPTPVASCVGTVSGCHDRVVILGSQPAVAVVPSASTKLPSSLPFRGTFAATLIDATTLQFEGVVTTAADGSPILPTQLPPTWNATGTHPYWLVQGWIAGYDVAVPCQPVPSPSAGPQYYGCGVTSSLGDTAAQPVSGTTFNVPKDGVQVQDRAYDDFAPSPLHLLIGQGGTVPELATFLVDQNLGACPPGIFCTAFGGYHWHIVTRIDPWPDAAQP